jgi:acetolactate synthase-1/3 small subunit
MTITTEGDEQIIEQIVKQLRKLITVIKVVDLTELKSVLREMVLMKINANDANRAEILRTVDIFRCKVVDVSIDEITIEATGNYDKIAAILSLLTRFGVKEISRSGMVAMKRSVQNS